jgi:hypothetical protein
MNRTASTWIAVVAVSLSCGCRRDDAAASAPTVVAAAASVENDLASILAEPGDVRRLQRLVEWVDARTPAQITAVLHDLPEDKRGELTWLLWLKLRDLDPGADESAIGNRLGELLAAGRPTEEGRAVPDLKEELLALADRSPREALERIGSTRIHPNKRSEIACAILARVAQTSPQKALELLASSPGDRRDGLIAIARVWVDKEPRAALAWAGALPPSEYNQGLVRELLDDWSAKDAGAAVEYISTLPVTPDNRYTFTRIIGKWLRDSPDDSAAWIQSRPSLDPLVLRAAIESLGATHPALVARLLDNPMDLSSRAGYRNRLAADWARADPVAARAWIEGLPPSDRTFDVIESFAGALAGKDLKAALAYYESLPRDAYTGDIAAVIAFHFDSPQEGLGWLLGQPDSAANRRAVADTLGRMQFNRAEDMLSMLGQLPEGPRRLPLYQAAASRWFNDDPAAAARWAAGLRDPDILQAVVLTGMDSWTANNAAGLGAVLAGVADDPRFKDNLSRFVSVWSQKDPVAASDWIAQNPNLKLPDYSVRRTFETLAEHAPAVLVEKLSALPAGGVHQQALGGALTALVKTSPQAAADLFTAQAGVKERRQLIGRVTAGWAAYDPDAAIAWTGTQPVSSTRDAGVNEMIYVVVKTDPQRAVSLASLASTPQAKDNLVGTAIQAWHNIDASAALAALDRADMSPEAREKLRTRLQRR